MPDEPIIDPSAELAGKPAELVTEPVIDPPVEPQVEVDPLKLSLEQQSRHKTAADLETFANQQQSEAQKAKNDLEAYKAQHPTVGQTQSPPPTNDELIAKFAENPDAFMSERINEAMAPLAVQVGLESYTNSGHPEMKNPEFRQAMNTIIEANPALVSDPKGLDMAYAYLKNRADVSKQTQANAVKETHNAEVLATKQGPAVVETSTASVKETSPKIVPGMSSAEMDKIFDAQNVGWVKDEDREYD